MPWSNPVSYMSITSSRLGSSAVGPTDVTELRPVKTLLLSVVQVPGLEEIVLWDLKLERTSSPPSHGPVLPTAGADKTDVALSVLLLCLEGG